ncbi:beta-microseminoprotein-like [Ranitomeya variabilis]|uniref:beta-microseminoprotein-like n=1 Tax=Ranitomeya variabilis TaxID=490064 RepID=UPI00405791C9
MALLLIFAVGLGFLVTSCSTDCHFTKKGMAVRGKVETGCRHNGELHPLHSKWQLETCEKCTCHQKGFECCTEETVVVGFNPKTCKRMVINCTATVVKKKNPNEICPHKVIVKNSDSTDSSDSTEEKGIEGDKAKSRSKSNSNESNDSDETKVDLEDYLALLEYIENADNCEENQVEEMNSESAESHDHASYN